MRAVATILRLFVGIDGMILIALGLLFWTGNADPLVPVHMLLGIALVLALWVLAALAAVAGVNLGLVALAFFWGLVVPALGLTQTRLLPNNAHWIIQVLHLLVGITAVALAQILALRIASRRPVPPDASRTGPSSALESSSIG